MTPAPKKDAGGFAKVETRGEYDVDVLIVGGIDVAVDERNLRKKADDINSAFSSRVKGLIEALEGFGKHDHDCARGYISQGRPTKDGGYEQLFHGKWYRVRPVDESPKCTCGLDKSLEEFRG